MKDELILKKNNTIQWHEYKDRIVLECPVSEGVPPSKITWFHNSEPVKDNFEIRGGNRTLNISQFDESFNGIYVCHAENEYGSVNYKFRLYLASNKKFI